MLEENVMKAAAAAAVAPSKRRKLDDDGGGGGGGGGQSDESESEVAMRELISYRNTYNIAVLPSLNKNKGLKRRIVEKASFEIYWNTLHNIKSHQATQVVIRSRKHKLATVKEKRAFTSPFDDKRHLYFCQIHSDAHYSSRIAENKGKCYMPGCPAAATNALADNDY
jgi:hypothetical protein